MNVLKWYERLLSQCCFQLEGQSVNIWLILNTKHTVHGAKAIKLLTLLNRYSQHTCIHTYKSMQQTCIYAWYAFTDMVGILCCWRYMDSNIITYIYCIQYWRKSHLTSWVSCFSFVLKTVNLVSFNDLMYPGVFLICSLASVSFGRLWRYIHTGVQNHPSLGSDLRSMIY